MLGQFYSARDARAAADADMAQRAAELRFREEYAAYLWQRFVEEAPRVDRKTTIPAVARPSAHTPRPA